VLEVRCGLHCTRRAPSGPGLGLGTAVVAGRLIASLLFGVVPADPWNLIAVAGVVVLTGLLAAHAPARRALRLDPMTALRTE
jgi:ABC-type antimicrobial peptide transport system permease subunit